MFNYELCSGFKGKGFRNLEFMAKTQFIWIVSWGQIQRSTKNHIPNWAPDQILKQWIQFHVWNPSHIWAADQSL